MKSRSTPDPPRDDHGWLLARLPVADVDLLWPHLEWAEARRLVALHGYLKDNAIPPPLADRLADPAFVADVHASIDDEADAEAACALEALLGCLALVSP